MLPNVSPELTPEQIASIEQARKTLPALKAEIRKAKSAGIDVSQQEADLAVLEQNLEKFYRVYIRKSSSVISPQ